MKARSVETSRYVRETDGIFGRVENFRCVREHRVQVLIGNSYFTSNKTYTSADGARLAAQRLQAKGGDHGE